MKTCLYVGNLPRDCTEETIRNLFAGEGRVVQKVTISIDHKTGHSRGFGFVDMGSEEDATAALAAVKGTELEGRTLKVGEAYREKGAKAAAAHGSEDAYEGGRYGRGGGGRGRR